MRTKAELAQETRFARQLWSNISPENIRHLRKLIRRYRFSVITGDILLIDGHWYVSHSGLLALAHRRKCVGISVRVCRELSDPKSSRWAFRATIYTSDSCTGFVGYGAAEPSNVSAVVRGAEMRVAETRAVNRALRKAYGIGTCSVEEIGSFPAPPGAPAQLKQLPSSQPANGNGAHPLRDRLCLLIRKHGLDAHLVKLYAADFCGTSELRQASRGQVAEFVTHLAQYAQHDREGLLCRLNSYAPKPPAPAVPDTSPEQEKVPGAA